MILKGKRIFIVEDNPQNRTIFQMILISHGAIVEFERWGEDALRRLRAAGKVDLIILDLMLPGGISGYDIFDDIRKQPQYDQTPIIAVSAAEPVFAIPKTQEKGFSGFIAKPLDASSFPKQIARIIAGEEIWFAGERFSGIPE